MAALAHAPLQTVCRPEHEVPPLSERTPAMHVMPPLQAMPFATGWFAFLLYLLVRVCLVALSDGTEGGKHARTAPSGQRFGQEYSQRVDVHCFSPLPANP